MPSKWKARDPSIFPIRYSDLVEASLSSGKRVLLETVRSSVEARSKLDHFREWRFCLRKRGSPANRCFTIERDHRICTYIIEQEGNFFDLFILVKPGRILSLGALNPDLLEL